MESWQIIRWGEPLEKREYPNPGPVGREVLVRVTSCGVCHSDLHIWQGYFDLGAGEKIRIEDRGLSLPFTMGHEVVGEVVAIGSEVRDVGVGERRIVYPWIGCGTCPECRRGEDLLCLRPRIIGTWKDGGYSDHVLVPDSKYLVDFGGIPEEVACTYACSGVTAYSALKKAGVTRSDQATLLIGAGGVGLQALGMAKAVVPGRVAMADTDIAKRDAAARFPADLVLDNGAPDAVRVVKEWSGGVDAAIDFVGRPETARFALDCLRKGGTLVVVGLYGDRLSLPLPWLPLRILTLKGSYVGTLDDLKAVVALARQGKLPLINVEPRPIEQVNSALTDLAGGRVTGRVVLKP